MEEKEAARHAECIVKCQSMPARRLLPHLMPRYVAPSKMDECTAGGGVWMI